MGDIDFEVISGQVLPRPQLIYCCFCCCFLSSVERLLLGMISLLITLLCSFLLSMMRSPSEEDLFTYRKNLL